MTTPNHNTADQSGADERLQKIVDGLNSCGAHLWAQELQAALASNQPAPTDFGIRWDLFPSYLLDHCEGDTITEEYLQGAVIDMLKSDDYKRITSQPSAPALPQASGDSHYSEEALTNELAAIRNLFPIPPQGSPLEEAWAASMSDPMEVSGFVRKAIAAQTAQAVAGQPWIEVNESALSGLSLLHGADIWLLTEYKTVLMGQYEWRQGRNPDRFIGSEIGDCPVIGGRVTHYQIMKRPAAPSQGAK